MAINIFIAIGVMVCVYYAITYDPQPITWNEEVEDEIVEEDIQPEDKQ